MTRWFSRPAGRPFAAFPLGLVLAVALGIGLALADDHDDHERARAALAAGEILPLGEILARLAVDFPGDVLEVELEREDGRWVYETLVLRADGAVIELYVDAASAEVMEVEGADLEDHDRRWDDD